MTLTFRGQVIGPTFNFNVKTFDFGVIPYGFKTTKEITLSNESLIPMDFHLRLRDDFHIDETNELVLTPSFGSIDAMESMTIRADFTPKLLKTYNIGIVVDIDDVKDEMKVLECTAKSHVPEVHPLFYRFRFRCAMQV